jgi:hypothetical protein
MQPRERERVHACIPVEFTGDAVSGKGRITNLAVSGCEIESETGPAPIIDTHLTLHLHVPRQQEALVIALAVVRWTKAHHFGVEFVRFEGGVGEHVRRLVSLLEPADPS